MQIRLATVLIGWTAAAGAFGCNTPVYRYAMYNWPPAPYSIFYLYRQAAAGADGEVHRLLMAVANDQAGANVVVHQVDVGDEKARDALPAAVRKAAAGPLPTHVVVSPLGVALHTGRLDRRAAAGLFRSPARTRIAEELHRGATAVFVILAGGDRQQLQDVEKRIDETIAAGTVGKIAAAGSMGSTDLPPPAVEDEDRRWRQRRGLRLARVTIVRGDPAEAELVAALMAVEPELDEFASTAMVFPVYGRGRAMPPFIGKGISPENLAECAGFLAGACSCQVKDENPGVDLPIAWDWQATAVALAEEDEESDGGQLSLRASKAPATSPAAATSATPSPRPAADGTAADRTASDGQPYAARQLSRYAYALVAAILVVLLIGTVLVRRRGQP